jgi:RNA polymerase sigma-70 factor (ECF subfamily)
MSIAPTEDFMRLFVAHRRRIYALILALVPDGTDADDVLQEASVTMWQNFQKFSPDTNFVAWAYPHVRFAALNFYRKMRRARKHVIFSDEIVERISDRLAAGVGQIGEREEALRNCVERLPDRARALLDLCYAPGASIREAATRLGRSAQSVSKSLYRVRESLVECVERRLATEEANR